MANQVVLLWLLLSQSSWWDSNLEAYLDYSQIRIMIPLVSLHQSLRPFKTLHIAWVPWLYFGTVNWTIITLETLPNWAMTSKGTGRTTRSMAMKPLLSAALQTGKMTLSSENSIVFRHMMLWELKITVVWVRSQWRCTKKSSKTTTHSWL